MRSATYKAIPWACLGVFPVLACLPGTAIQAQQAPTTHSPQQVLVLDPPTGMDLQAHVYDGKGAMLPDAPANFRRFGEARVGELSDLHTLTLRFSKTTKLTEISVTKDFRIESGGSCTVGNVYECDSTCRLLVRFTPQGPGNRLGRLLVSNSSSAIPAAFGLGGYGYAPVLSFIPAQITTLPGSYPSSVGLLNGAQNLTIDGGDTLWVSDTGNNVVRNYDSSATFKTLTTTATGPRGIAVDTFGQAYFDEPSANTMHEIYDYGPVVQINGSGTGACPASTPCTLSLHAVTNPGTMSMDPYNHLFFTEQSSGSAFSTVQPLPANLIFLYNPFPYQTNPSSPMAVDAGDNLYSLWSNGGTCSIIQSSLYNAENSNVSFNKIAGGHTCGFAGDGGLAGNAEIGAKVGQFAFDTAGDLYFTDSNNQRVRRIDYTTGVIRTVAGNGTAGYTGDGSQSTAATLSNPTGVGVDSTGAIYTISSTTPMGTAQVIRKVGPQGYVNFGNQSKGTTSAAQTLVVSNTGNSSMVFANYAFVGANPSEFKFSGSNTTCILTPGATLYAGQTCAIGFYFTPAGTGTRSATFRLLSNTVSGTNDTTLIGTGTLPTPTFKITSPANGATFKSGTAVTFSVSVTGSGSQPTGKVQFKVDGANFGSAVTLSSTGSASTSVTGLTQTTHNLSATYGGDGSYAAAGPIGVSITVKAAKVASSVSLSTTASTNYCSPLHFAVAVTSDSKTVPTGAILLLDGSATLVKGALSDGKAVLSTSPLSPGKHTLTAAYAGDSTHQPAASPAVIERGFPIGTCRVD